MALSLGACVSVDPRPLVRVTPNGAYRWHHGRALVRATHRGVHFVAAFEADRGDHTEWLVHVDNRSTREVMVSPENFHYRAAGARTRASGGWVSAIDPAEAIARIDRAAAREEASHTQARANRVGGVLAESFMDRLFDEEPETRREAAQRRRIEEMQRHDARSSRAGRRAMLANGTLRRTMLAPGESVSGRVLFPRLERQGATELLLWADGALATFRFAQRLEPVQAEPARRSQRAERPRW